MTISKDLFLSILSMDAYNRGYNPGLAGLGGLGSGVGNAVISTDSETTSSTSATAQAASFYAISYTIGAGVTGIAQGTTVISYRGTDEPAKELALVDFAISSGGSFARKQIACLIMAIKAMTALKTLTPPTGTPA